MNYSRSIARLLATSALASSLSVLMSQPAKADLFCYPWESNCHVDGEPGTSGNNKLGGQQWYFVSVKNNSDRTIWVAAHFRVTPPNPSDNSCDNCNPPFWRTDGYWKLEPGKKALILNSEDRIDNRYIYFHAHDAQGRTWGTSELKENVGSEVQPFFKQDMGSEITNFTQSFD